jgi:phosphomannomutase
VEAVAQKHPNRAIASDVRVRWPIELACQRAGMKYEESASGYRYIKEKMMEKDAVFGAEMTAHYFFAETFNMDNGLIPFLMIWDLLSVTGKTLSELVAPYKENHAMMDEIKLAVEDPKPIIARLKEEYKNFQINELDGLTVESDEFRFNLRASNTEPVAKLNMEAKSFDILDREKEKLIKLIKE